MVGDTYAARLFELTAVILVLELVLFFMGS